MTSGKIIFAISFFIVFIIGMLWSYRKDKIVNKLHFKGSLKILGTILVIFGLVILYVKLRHKV